MLSKNKLMILLQTLRAQQWIKNLVVFVAVIFSGNLFVPNLLLLSFYAFGILCLLSSTSYVLNDIIDYPYDRKHPVKKNRPIASGRISVPEATFIVFILTLVSLILSLFISVGFFFLAFFFILLHFFYSLYFKKHAVIDIFVISFSFMIRTFAGEVVTGYHIPIWFLLTIFFGSLFMATVKRHAELVSSGKETRESLVSYRDQLLSFLSNTFATITIVAYSFYTYFEKPPETNTVFSQFFTNVYADYEVRKWMMVTIPLVVYGIARYAQLLYEKHQGERPEKIITTDVPLIATMTVWGLIVVGLIYVF